MAAVADHIPPGSATVCVRCGGLAGVHCPACGCCPRPGRRPALRCWQRWFPRSATGCPVHEVITGSGELTSWTPLGGDPPRYYPTLPTHPMHETRETEVPL